MAKRRNSKRPASSRSILPSTSALEEVRIEQEATYQRSVRVLGRSTRVLDEILSAYDLLRQLIQKGLPNQSSEMLDESLAFRIGMLWSSRSMFVSALLTALRGHTTETANLTRRAIELAAFVGRIVVHPDLAKLWMNPDVDEASLREYRRLFSGGRIFPQGKVWLRTLQQGWNTLSRLSHASAYSIREHVHMGWRDGDWIVAFENSIPEIRPREPTLTVVRLAVIHFSILKVFAEAFPGIVEPSDRGWKSAIDEVQGHVLGLSSKYQWELKQVNAAAAPLNVARLDAWAITMWREPDHLSLEWDPAAPSTLSVHVKNESDEVKALLADDAKLLETFNIFRKRGMTRIVVECGGARHVVELKE